MPLGAAARGGSKRAAGQADPRLTAPRSPREVAAGRLRAARGGASCQRTRSIPPGGTSPSSAATRRAAARPPREPRRQGRAVRQVARGQAGRQQGAWPEEQSRRREHRRATRRRSRRRESRRAAGSGRCLWPRGTGLPARSSGRVRPCRASYGAGYQPRLQKRAAQSAVRPSSLMRWRTSSSRGGRALVRRCCRRRTFSR